jgi:hypothetical protein
MSETKTKEPRAKEAKAQLETLHCEITGIRPLLMRNSDLADPENLYAKEINEIHRMKSKDITKEKRERREWLDFRGGLYWDETVGLYIKSDSIERCVQLGAQKSGGLGKKVQSCVFCTEPIVPLIYEGPRDPQGLYDAGFFLRVSVVIGKSRIFRVRPKIDDWQLRFGLCYDNSIVGRDGLMRSVINAGALIGLGDWRPKFGRFTCRFLDN